MSGNLPMHEERTDRNFFVIMALAMAATVAVGFGPTFYLKPVMASPPLTPSVWVHGVLFTGWIALLVTQASLVAKGRVEIHMRLGMLGVLLAIMMVVVGLLTAIQSARLGRVPPGAPPPLVFLAIPFFAIAEFAALFACAVALRGNGAAHKRLMLLATVAIIPAAIARFPLAFAGIPPVFFAMADCFILAGVLFDRQVHGRVHPAYLWAGGAMVLMQPAQLALMGTGAWLAFAQWLVG